MKDQNSFIERIKSELLLTLFDYVVPFVNKKINIKTKENKTHENHRFSGHRKSGSCEQVRQAHSHFTGFSREIKNIEDIVNSKPKIDFKDFKELEFLLLENLNENIKINKNKVINSNNIQYSLDLTKQKNIKENSDNYSILINYEENQKEDKLKISIKSAEKELYSAEITNKKDLQDKVVPYSVKISYENSYAEERLAITYKQQLKNYLKQHIESKEDMSNRVPLKWLNILPETMMGGVLGFTYLGENFMGRRADLTGKTARMVDIHESIHTPDEYETRVLTSWIMEKIRPKYFK